MYGTTGEQFAKAVSLLAEQAKAKSILDYGCGKRTLERSLQQIWCGVPVCEIVNYDPCIAGLGEKKPCDVVVCTDVLEHVEPECFPEVMADLKSMMKKIGFFTVHTEPAMKHLSDGRNAHLIQQPYDWWMARLSEHFWVMKMVNVGADVFFTVARDREQSEPFGLRGQQHFDGKPEFLKVA